MSSTSKAPLRVALFPDSYDEPNGVATLSRNLAEFARSRGYPFLVVHGGNQTRLTKDGSLEVLELKRGAASFCLDKSLYCDPLLTRHKQVVVEHLSAFKPDLLHITGPGDLGFLGLQTAHALRVPLVASWHTNLHEYLARRLAQRLRVMPKKLRESSCRAAERQTLRGFMRFYQTAHFVLAPNQLMVDLLSARTGRPSFLMRHGVDLTAYDPEQRCNNGNGPFCIGYVGRLTAEKNVRLLAELEQRLLASGERNFKFLIVGDGAQRQWLRKHLINAELPGVLRGQELTAAYGRMDVFVFPSRTDTFGLVLLEAMACGVPAIVPPEAGARVGIEDGVSGLLTEDFAEGVQRLMQDCRLRSAMGCAARQVAGNNDWQAVFEQLYLTYSDGLTTEDNRRAEKEGSTRGKPSYLE